MKYFSFFIVTLLLTSTASFVSAKINSLFLPGEGSAEEIDFNVKVQVQQGMANTQYGFLENKGQMTDIEQKAAPYLLFKAEGKRGVDMYITQWGLSYVLIQAEEENKKMEYCRADMVLSGASIKKENIIKEYESENFSNYYLGHCSEGILNVRRYGKITIKEVYPNIDWVLYTTSLPSGEGQGGGVKYDFIVHPGGIPNQIKLQYKWTDSPEKQSDGSLSVRTPMGTITEGVPYSYLKETNAQVQTQYTINKETNEVSFTTANYAPQQTLIIDPELLWGTYFGASYLDGFCSVKTDDKGNVFVTGYTGSADFPTLNPGGGAYFQGTYNSWNGFILKFDNKGVLLWATYYIGSNVNVGASIAVDGNGNVFVTGRTSSTDFMTLNPGGGAYFQAANGGGLLGPCDAFILKCSNTGMLLWATYYGGGGWDYGNSLAIDGNGNVFVTGITNSSNFPVFNPGGGAYFQGTYSGGSGGLTTGEFFLLKFTNNGVRLWATYYGGNGDDSGLSIAADSSGNVFVTGNTTSSSFPVFNPGGGTYFQATNAGNGDAFLLKFNNTGVRLWATYYGGSGGDSGQSIAIDGGGNMFVIGATSSTNFSTFNPGGGAYFQAANAGGSDAFLLKFSNDGIRLWATYYGGDLDEGFYTAYDSRDHEITIDQAGNVFGTGTTLSSNFPTLNPGGGAYFQGANSGGITPFGDVFLLEFSNTGMLLWASYSGTAAPDFGAALAIDPSGCLFAVGEWNLYKKTGTSNGLLNPGGSAYFDSIWDPGGDDSYIMKFCPSLAVATTPINILCNGQCNGTATANVMSGTNPYTYNWNNGQTTQTATGLCAGIYTVVVTNVAGATVTATVIITQPTLLTATATATNTCSNTNGSVTVNSTGGTPDYTYSWSPGGQTTSTVTGLATGNYIVAVTDSNGCIATQTVAVVSSGSVTATATSSTICAGQNAILTASGGNIYSWSNGTTGTIINVSPSSTSTYSVIVSDGNCLDTTSAIVTVNPNPTAFIASNVTITQGQSVTLTASGPPNGGYSWSNGVNSSSITVTPLATTIYCVTVTDANNCTDTACVAVTVGPIDCSNSGELYIPNAFSPNGDNENDVLKMYYRIPECLKYFKLVIYNRWGEKVFETKNPIAEWDGIYKGKIENTAVFVYYLEATLLSGEEIRRKGNICILR